MQTWLHAELLLLHHLALHSLAEESLTNPCLLDTSSCRTAGQRSARRMGQQMRIVNFLIFGSWGIYKCKVALLCWSWDRCLRGSFLMVKQKRVGSLPVYYPFWVFLTKAQSVKGQNCSHSLTLKWKFNVTVATPRKTAVWIESYGKYKPFHSSLRREIRWKHQSPHSSIPLTIQMFFRALCYLDNNFSKSDVGYFHPWFCSFLNKSTT